MIYRFSILLFLFALCFATLSGCAHHDLNISSSSAPLNEILKPVKDSRLSYQKKPLIFPASVAIVTVHGSSYYKSHVPITTIRQAGEKIKEQLL
ncbi:MAG: hypothetical protein P8X63_10590, partial [Desulfuromonadaceae bacterium]